MLVDISARAPYGLKVAYSTKDNPGVLDKVADVIGIDARFGMIKIQDGHGVLYGLQPSESIKPMLRPMSSMTEDEKEELLDRLPKCWSLEIDKLGDLYFDICDASYPDIELLTDIIEWLHKHHFNYRLPKHLFIDVTKENNPYNATRQTTHSD